MDIKIKDTSAAIEDANKLVSCANKLSSIVSTMSTLKRNFEENWIEEGIPNKNRQRIVDDLGSNIDYYVQKIIPALEKLGNAVNAYAIATEQIANATIENPSLSGITPSQLSDAQNVQSYQKGEEYTIDLTNINYRDTSTKTYMNWDKITSKTSKQFAFRTQAKNDGNIICDEDGFYMVNDGTTDRYVVAMTQKYGDIGEYVDVHQADGSVLKCVIGDAKSYNNDNSGEYGHMYGNSVNVVEFITNWPKNHSNPGTVRTNLSQNVLKVINTGKSYKYTNGTSKY